MKCIKGSAAEQQRKKRAFYAHRHRAQQYSTAGKESPDDLETGVTGQCHGAQKPAVEVNTVKKTLKIEVCQWAKKLDDHRNVAKNFTSS